MAVRIAPEILEAQAAATARAVAHLRRRPRSPAASCSSPNRDSSAPLCSATVASTSLDIQLGYSTCESNCHAPQRQDAFAFAFSVRPPLFNGATPVGTTLALQPQSGIPINGQMVSTFPSGTPIFLTFGDGEFNDFSATAYSKDLVHNYPQTALVTYGANSTATIDFRTAAGAHIRVGLTNVRGSSAGGC